MKEFEKRVPYLEENRIEMNVKKQQEVELLLKGAIKPQKGHFVWEINEETGEILKAQYKRNTVSILDMNVKDNIYTEELVIKTDCIYIPALNAENAKKKYLKNKEQQHYYKKEAPADINELKFF